MAAPPGATATSLDLNDELWTTAHLATYLHCGRSTAFDVARDATFPAPIAVGATRRRLWIGREIRSWATAGHRQRPAAPRRTTVDKRRP